MAIKDNRRNSAAVQPVSAGGAGGGSGGVSAERAAGVSGGHGQTSESSGGGKLGVWALAGVVVSSMIGGGIYSLPQNMAAGASVGAVLLAWLITGIGVYFLANTFRILSVVKPDLTAGIYMYSRAGFGPYVGFTIGWSYWLCQICGNVGYAVITMDALNYFFPPYFAGGNGIYSIIGGSLLIWGFNALVLKGIKQATIINLIGTVAKIAPLLFFIVITLIFFNSERFSFDFWGERERSLGGLAKQIEGTMLVTLWAFIGIEGAVVMSKHAKNPKAVGTATLLGFSGCLLIYVLLSVLPYGIMDQEQLSKLPNPSTAAVLEPVIGKWGSYIMNIGLLISVLTSWLAWTMVTAQIPQAAAENGTFPKEFVKENAAQAPSVSLYVTSGLMQVFMLLVYFRAMLGTRCSALPALWCCRLILRARCICGNCAKTTNTRPGSISAGRRRCFPQFWGRCMHSGSSMRPGLITC